MAEVTRWRRAPLAGAIALINVVAFAALVAEQATEWDTRWDPSNLAWWVGGVTIVLGLILVAVVTALWLVLPRWWIRLAIALAAAALQALVRTLILLPVTTASHGTPAGFTVWATGMAGFSVALAAGIVVGALLEREDRERERRIAEEHRSREAIDDLEREEMRIRRIVADRLHGAVQHRLVVVASGLEQAAARLGDAELREALQGWAADLDELREEHVRSLSHSLFPSGADLSTYAAIRALLDRMPLTVATSIVLGPTMREVVHRHHAVLPLLDRLVVVYTIEEAATNALKHGAATAITVHAELVQRTDDGWILDVVVDDDGTGPADDSSEFSGLARHRARAEARGGSLDLGRNDAGGGRLHLVLPFVPVSDVLPA